MIEAAHLTEQQFSGFRHRTLEPADLLAVDRHLAVCAGCRDRLASQSGAFTETSALRTLLSEHLDYDQTVAAAHGSAGAAIQQHLAECAMCRDEVEDLRQFRSELAAAPGKVIAMPSPKPRWRILAFVAIAAGLLLAAGLTVFRQPGTPVAQVRPAAVQPVEAAIPPDQLAAVQLALSTHRLERAPVLDGLITKRGVLLGAPGEPKSFAVRAPVGTTVLNSRPVFRWESVPGASKYVVAVFDDHFQKVAESPAVTAAEWTPEQPVARGRIYNWQVTAYIGTRTLRSPVPPAPEARFQVVSADTAAQIETARRDHAGNHPLLAVLLANAGALDESALELDALAASDPATAQSLRQSLQAIRHSAPRP
uniref:Zinc-finger domain-containing protein n=1 Tax=Solibacter usitatus (strain Ellin6076) TaxID=234267 RepID=Q022H7_SOLUE